jgi:hypothetical protein
MKKNYSSKKVLQACLLFFMIITTNMFAQVGIGTTTPNASSILDLTSSTQGMLTPRMTTAQRIAIVSPADGLMVYDTDLKSFFHFDTSISTWDKINTDANYGRIKFKRLKSTDVLSTVLAAEKTAGGGTKYLLDATTFYEINGTVIVDLPIEMNGAYIAGLDSSDDKLVKTSGDLFTGTTGGSLRELTITVIGGGKAFNMVGTGSIGAGTQTQSFILTNAIVGGCSNVGKIENFALVFLSIVQFASNTTGIVYKDVSKLLLSNEGWFGNNSGTYETLQGTFGLVGKIGGFSEVIGSSVGFDTSVNPTITGDAVLKEVVFTGTLSTGKYVNGYSPAVYTGYNFNNKWAVNSSGIPTTTSNNLYRFSNGGTDNRLTYLGSKRRYFRAAASFSFQSSVSAAGVFIFYVAKNGVVINQSKVYCGVNSSDIDAATIVSTVDLTTNDYIEVWVSRFSGTGNMLTVSLNLVVN